MFDVGALELLVIAVVALIVVGPERLPKLARTAGLWVSRARRAFASVKEEIDREIKADELREILRKQAESKPLETIIEEGMGLSDGAKELPRTPSPGQLASEGDAEATSGAARGQRSRAAESPVGDAGQRAPD